MKRRSSTRKAPPIALLLSLLVIAGIASYGVMAGFFPQPKNDSNDHSQNTSQPPAPPDARQCITHIPTITKIQQKIMVAVFSSQIDELLPILSAHQVGGVIIMDQVTKPQIDSIRAALKIPPFVAVDQEGGTVQRYKSEGTLAGASDIAKLTPSQAYDAYAADSRYLASLGITTNFAPVVDVESKPISPLPGRIYSSDPQVVTTYATEAIKAMHDNKLQPVIKHFPGLGSASGNTDFTTATTDPYSALKNRDLIPYQELKALLPDVMVGNMVVPELTNNQPAIWSSDAITLLRSMGYENAVVYTDSLTAQAVPGSLAQAAFKTWQAGSDVAVIVQEKAQIGQLMGDIQQIIVTTTAGMQNGTLSSDTIDQSTMRILSRKQVDPCSVSQ